MQSKQIISNAEGDKLQNSAMAQGYQSQQQLKVISQQKVQKSPSSYMSEENAPPHMLFEQKKVKFYSQIVAIKETRLIENLASLKTQKEKQKCIDQFTELFDDLIKNIIEMSDIIKQIRFSDLGNQKANAPTVVHSQASGQINNNANANAASSMNPNVPNQAAAAANTLGAADPKSNVEISELPDQIIKDCKSIHNIFADLVQDSSLKHLELCCETFQLEGSAVNLKYKISQWYTDIKDYIEKNRPLNQQNRNANKKNGGNPGKGIGSILCPCFGSKSKPPNATTTNNCNNNLNRNNTTQAIQNQKTNFQSEN
ncbi:hypothetical protein ABPG72_015843 [Tetrahymena utriculariae]